MGLFIKPVNVSVEFFLIESTLPMPVSISVILVVTVKLVLGIVIAVVILRYLN